MVRSNSSPVGVFDSGIGGLTVMQALQDALPHEQFVYLGDTARVPYGLKSPQTVVRYTLRIADYLYGLNVKMLVVACNTASAHAMEALQQAYPDLPVVGVVEPGAEAAYALSRRKHIAVLATAGTIQSAAYRRALEKRGEVIVVDQACPLLVPLAEEGWIDDEVTRLVAERYLGGIRDAGVDTAILGCTHYPLLKETLAAVLGKDIVLVDSAHTTATWVAAMLRRKGLETTSAEPGRSRYLLTDAATRFVAVGERFLGHGLGDIELVDL